MLNHKFLFSLALLIKGVGAIIDRPLRVRSLPVADGTMWASSPTKINRNLRLGKAYKKPDFLSTDLWKICGIFLEFSPKIWYNLRWWSIPIFPRVFKAKSGVWKGFFSAVKTIVLSYVKEGSIAAPSTLSLRGAERRGNLLGKPGC